METAAVGCTDLLLAIYLAASQGGYLGTNLHEPVGNQHWLEEAGANQFNPTPFHTEQFVQYKVEIGHISRQYRNFVSKPIPPLKPRLKVLK